MPPRPSKGAKEKTAIRLDKRRHKEYTYIELHHLRGLPMSKNKRPSVLPNIEDMKRHVLFKSRGLMVVYIFLCLFVLFTLVRSFLRGEYANVLVCLLTLVLFMIPAFVEKNFKVHLTSFFESIVLLFIFSSEILGEINCYYEKIPHWDSILHTVNGFLFAAFGFALLDMINRDSHIKFKLSPIYLALVAFCFSMTIGVLWEFFEFGSDMLLHGDMQKDTYIEGFHTMILDEAQSNTAIEVEGIQEVVIRLENGEELILPAYLDIGLFDTMKDLMVNFIGALIFSIIGFFYVKHKGKGRIAEQFIPRLYDNVDKKTDASPDVTSEKIHKED